MPAKYIHILILEPLNVTFSGKRNLLKLLRILSGRDFLGLSGQAQNNHKSLLRGTQEEPKLEEKIEAEIRVMCFEAGGRGHKSRNAGGH